MRAKLQITSVSRLLKDDQPVHETVVFTPPPNVNTSPSPAAAETDFRLVGSFMIILEDPRHFGKFAEGKQFFVVLEEIPRDAAPL